MVSHGRSASLIASFCSLFDPRFRLASSRTASARLRASSRRRLWGARQPLRLARRQAHIVPKEYRAGGISRRSHIAPRRGRTGSRRLRDMFADANTIYGAAARYTALPHDMPSARNQPAPARQAVRSKRLPLEGKLAAKQTDEVCRATNARSVRPIREKLRAFLRVHLIRHLW